MYRFYGWERADIRDARGLTPRDYYDLLSKIWAADTCAPRMRQSWRADNPTLGQCSVTAFLMQDIFGGQVLGVPRKGGTFHCFNAVGDCVFDLTSEQFGDEVLSYADCPEQRREYHFARAEKLARYELLRDRLNRALADAPKAGPRRVTVYLGANPGSDPALRDAVRALGRWIGESGRALVYGGSKSGLMGDLAESTLQAGGEVTGVEPRFFIEAGFEYDAITRLIVTEDMAERKAKMIELGDAFIAFPGGTGTLEEIAEVMSKVSLGHLNAPCILYNLNGYYDGLKAQLRHMIEMGLSSPERQRGIFFADDLAAIRAILES